MCGILGMYAGRSRIPPAALARATAALGHRGPDGSKTWVAPHSRVGLGHTRLSIIDLVTGDQPLANEDERLHMVVNGEFYGFEHIRETLIRRGHCFRSASDSEIALHLYEEYGLKFVDHLRGEFAVILWDESSDTLIAARDRFGVKPLFYAMHDNVLMLASEIKALLAAGVPARWDRDAFFQHIFVCMDQSRTLFQGIRQVPPGHFLRVSGDRVEVVSYWDLDYPSIDCEPSTCSTEDFLEALRYTLEDAVRVRLRADVPVGCFLSGGLDSSAVFGLATRASQEPMRAFTVTFDHPAYDEGHVARETAAFLGGHFHPVAVREEDLADHFEATVWHAETLGQNAQGVARFLHSRAVREAGYKVVLSGEGADEIFAGYIYSRMDFLVTPGQGRSDSERGRLLEELQRLNPAFRSVLFSHSGGGVPALERALGFTPAWLQAMATSRAHMKEMLTPEFRQEFADRDPYAIFLSQFDVAAKLSGRDPVLQSLYLWFRSILPNQILFADRLEMANGVEVRTPFLDHHVYDLVRQMPVQLLIRGNREKHVLREAMRSVLTPTVYRRPKQPFTAPPSTLRPNGRLFKLAKEVLTGTEAQSQPFFSAEAIRLVLERIPQMDDRRRIEMEPLIMMMLSACVLQKLFKPHS